MEKIVCTTDEIIYNIKDETKFNLEFFMEDLRKKINNIDLIYRVEQFRLRQLYPYDYFIKEIINQNTNKIKYNLNKYQSILFFNQ